MTLNREIYLQDPLAFPIPNDGVAQVLEPQTPEQWKVLRYELQSFVCEGEYHAGLERILSTFLRNLNQPKQPAVWVSGFFGSGKSHLVRVLEYLWRDVKFPDGATARGLTRLPDDINDALKELSTEGKRSGGLWSAAGTLGAGVGSNVRMALLAILFRSAGLPDKFTLAKFVLWLKQNGYYDTVKAGVENSGKDFAKELGNLYVSDALAKSLLAAYPTLAETPAQARVFLKETFPNRDDISDTELTETMRHVLEQQSQVAGKLPLTLLIFDELQQFLNEDSTRTLAVQNVVELCSAQFGSSLLFVATGQSALTATTMLQKLRDRFTVTVPLQDTDVQNVVRQVVLRKKPAREPELKQLLETTSGEIDRQLQGTNIAPTFQDQAVLVADYPLLPARRRFWERALRAIDQAGTSGQLRTQLRIVHDAARATAEQPLGSIVAGDFIFEQLRADMLQSGLLLRDENVSIQELADGTADGALRSRLCALIFLIGKLPTTGPLVTGIRADANTLADLLVDNLVTGGSALRQRVPALLQELTAKGTLMLVGDEYRLQTREGAEWDAEFKRRNANLFADDARLAEERIQEFRQAVAQQLKGISITQGLSKTPRAYALHFGADAPEAASAQAPVWVRDEWAISEAALRQEAQAAGNDDPLVYVLLPRRDADGLRAALAAHAAAKATLEQRPTPTSDEGRSAKSAMETRERNERARLDGIIANIVSSARVFQGGGNEVVETTFKASVERAVRAALDRLFPKFGVVDAANWNAALKRAQDGNVNALEAIGYNGDVDKYAGCVEIRNYIGAAGKRGNDVRGYFEGAGFGWPRDAVDGCLAALVAGGFVRAARNGQPFAVKQLTQAQIGLTDFFSEGISISASQRLAVRKLLQDLGVPNVQSNQEPELVPQALQKLRDLADGAGGDAPLPAKPAVTLLEALLNKSGNEQFVAVYDARAELTDLDQEWTRRRALISQRSPRWDMLTRLLKHARALPVAADLAPQVDALRANRSLLDDPDPLAPLLNQVTAALRAETNDARKKLVNEFEAQTRALQASAEWKQLTPAQQQTLLQQNNLNGVAEINIGTDAALLETLDRTSLQDFQDQLVALPARAANARAQAAQLLAPQAVRLTAPHATLHTVQELDVYLDALRAQILQHIENGNPVIL